MASNLQIKSKKDVTNLLIRDFNIMQLGYDFMGYRIPSRNSLSFHHMIIPHDECRRLGIEHSGYLYWNGAILVQETSHTYLHLVGECDRFKFDIITSEMIVMNERGYLDKDCLKEINDCLMAFELEHNGELNSKGKRLIKSRWINERIGFY
ncbi:MAG: hypothetical protein IKQ35_02055 [Bacilli bacterium]|nr:hypothetical protein [Bacilli bacterium]